MASDAAEQRPRPQPGQMPRAADLAVRAARLSVISNSALVALKLAAGLLMGSVSVLSEAIHSALDLVAAGIAFYSVRQSRRPADEHHPFGHGKVENIAGTVEALLIFAAAIWIIAEAARKLIRGVRVESLGIGLLVMGLAAVVNLLVSRYLFRVARQADSVALRADALHLSTDVWTSAGVFVGLVIMAVTGYHIVDPVAALVVAVLIIHAAWDLTREAFSPLLDTSLPPEERQAIEDIISRHRADFVDFHRMRSRRAGPQRHIDLHLVVHGDHTVAEAHALCDAIEREIEGRFPRTDVVIHVEPSPPGDPTGSPPGRTRR
ncbi:MAG: cation diffusion facilitator family transporter [Bacillota bacterium]